MLPAHLSDSAICRTQVSLPEHAQNDLRVLRGQLRLLVRSAYGMMTSACSRSIRGSNRRDAL